MAKLPGYLCTSNPVHDPITDSPLQRARAFKNLFIDVLGKSGTKFVKRRNARTLQQNPTRIKLAQQKSLHCVGFGQQVT
jgi:hypothetical protein